MTRPQHESREQGAQERSESADAWTVLSYVLSGPLVYGGLGWALDQWFGTPFLLPLGLLGGGAASVYLVYVRYVKSRS